jgi:parallel beta-helix repeat protein
MDAPPGSSLITRRIAVGTLLAAGAVALPAKRSFATGTNKVIYASSYGVVADGVTNDAVALTNAIAAMSNGYVLVLPAGTMALGSSGWVGILFSGLSNIVIQGNNTAIKWLATPSQQTGPIGATGLRLYNCNDAIVSGIVINGNAVGCIGVGLDTCTICTVTQLEAYGHAGVAQFAACKGTGNTWTSCSAHNSVVGSACRGFLLGNSNSGWGETDLAIRGCSAQNNDATGFAIEGVRVLCADNNSANNKGAGFTSSTATGSPSTDHLFLGNTGRQNAFHGWQADVYGPNAARIVLSGNNFSDNTNSGIYCAKATDVTVTGNVLSNNGSTNGSAAIALIDSNDVIIANNVIDGDSTYGTCISSAYASNTLSDIVITNNRCVGATSNTLWLQTVDSASSLRRVLIACNIVHGGACGLWLGTATAGGIFDTVTVANNIFESATSASYLFHDTTAGQSTNVRLTGNAGGASSFNSNFVPYLNYNNVWNASVGSGVSSPAVGTWAQGAIIFNSSPVAGGTIGWVCTTGGTPGTWKSFGSISP